MKALAKFLSNSESIEKARELGYDVPEPEFVYDELYFFLEDVRGMHLDNKGDIRLFINMPGIQEWTIKFDEDLWHQLRNHIYNK